MWFSLSIIESKPSFFIYHPVSAHSFYSETVVSQSPAIYKTFNTDLSPLPIFNSLSPPFWPSPHPSLLFISPSLSLRLHHPSNCLFSLHNASDSQFIQWQDASISWKAEECRSVLQSRTCSPGLYMASFEHSCLMKVCFEFGRCEPV